LQRQLDNGQPSAIDAYAATNPEEYFAVTSELHFSRPVQLAQAAPEVARLLTGLYGAPPAALVP
jgi:Mlc titration factor MtfA (ptsG expression regulator)